MIGKSPLDDPAKAAHAWKRFRRLMLRMLAMTLAVVALILFLLYQQRGGVSIHFYIAVGLGVGFSMLLMSALMGLVFLSNGTGHDSSIDNRLPDNEAD
jgi:membrane glycosyltransferase